MKFCLCYTTTADNQQRVFFNEYRHVKVPGRQRPLPVPIPLTFNTHGMARHYGDKYFQRAIAAKLVTNVISVSFEFAMKIIKRDYPWVVYGPAT